MPTDAASPTRLPGWTAAWRGSPALDLAAPEPSVSRPGDAPEREADAVSGHTLHGDATAPIPLSPVRPVIQRQAVEGEEEAPARTPTVEESPEGLLVEDTATALGPGQMTKSDFLEALRAAVCATAEEALADTIWSAAGCPWIDQWFDYYAEKDAAHVERALRRYVPEAAGVTDAAAYIPLATARVRRAIDAWSTTGEVTGVPEGVPTALPDAEPPPGSNSETGAGGIGFLERPGGPRTANGPRAVQRQLGGGQPLAGSVRTQMESAYGVDLSGVRLHTDATAAGLADRLNAHAFTIGRDIAFAPGAYQPGTPVGDAILAHELAHVVQQAGGSREVAPLTGDTGRTGEDEQRADRSAAGVVQAVWGGARGALAEVARNAVPRLRSGLRLQRCSKDTSTGPMGPGRLAQARAKFQSNNSHLTTPELAKIDAAIGGVATDNVNVAITFYDYFTNHDIVKLSGSDLTKSRRAGLLAQTKPNSDIELDPDTLAPSFPNNRLGALLIHEFTHTRHTTVAMGMGDYQEGDSYAIEYFYAERTGDTARKTTIQGLLSRPTTIVLSALVGAFLDRFRASYRAMVGLYEVIDSGRSTAGALVPGTAATGTPLAGLTRDEARALVAELIAKAEASRSQKLRDILIWVMANGAAFPTTPI